LLPPRRRKEAPDHKRPTSLDSGRFFIETKSGSHSGLTRKSRKGTPRKRSNGSETHRKPVSKVADSRPAMARTGRPSSLTPATQQRIVAAVRAGASRRQAADAGGVSRATLSRWLSLGLEPGAPERYAEFNRAVRAAQDGATRQRFEDDRRDAERSGRWCASRGRCRGCPAASAAGDPYAADIFRGYSGRQPGGGAGRFRASASALSAARRSSPSSWSASPSSRITRAWSRGPSRSSAVTSRSPQSGRGGGISGDPPGRFRSAPGGSRSRRNGHRYGDPDTRDRPGHRDSGSPQRRGVRRLEPRRRESDASIRASTGPTRRSGPSRPAKRKPRCTGAFLRWARLVSNQRPLACEASALPLSYAPGRRAV
jgi:hypothetical protein